MSWTIGHCPPQQTSKRAFGRRACARNLPALWFDHFLARGFFGGLVGHVPFGSMNVWMCYLKDTGKDPIKQDEIRCVLYRPLGTYFDCDAALRIARLCALFQMYPTQPTSMNAE